MSLRRVTAEEGGFTLAELIVAMFAGIIILSATLTVLELSMRQSINSTDRVDGTQRGRSAMEQIVQELHSSCVWASATPVQAPSDGSNLLFISAFSSAPLPTPVLHKIWLDSAGNLKDASYPLTGSATNPSSWTPSAFSANPSMTKTLASNVSVQSGSSTVFSYYQYVTGQLAADATHQLTPPLTSTNAPAVAEVAIKLAVGPQDGSTKADQTVNMSDTVVLAPPPTTGVECQ